MWPQDAQNGPLTAPEPSRGRSPVGISVRGSAGNVEGRQDPVGSRASERASYSVGIANCSARAEALRWAMTTGRPGTR